MTTRSANTKMGRQSKRRRRKKEAGRRLEGIYIRKRTMKANTLDGMILMTVTKKEEEDTRM